MRNLLGNSLELYLATNKFKRISVSLFIFCIRTTHRNDEENAGKHLIDENVRSICLVILSLVNSATGKIEPSRSIWFTSNSLRLTAHLRSSSLKTLTPNCCQHRSSPLTAYEPSLSDLCRTLDLSVLLGDSFSQHLLYVTNIFPYLCRIVRQNNWNNPFRSYW